MTLYEATHQQYLSALERLGEVLALEKTDVVRDSAIQRFEFTFDLAWKLIKAYMEDELKVRCASPKKCFREAYNQELITYEIDWLKMADDRNLTAHMYQLSIADKVYERLPQYLALFQSLAEKIKS